LLEQEGVPGATRSAIISGHADAIKTKSSHFAQSGD
jgi:hypothetical protein